TERDRGLTGSGGHRRRPEEQSDGDHETDPDGDEDRGQHFADHRFPPYGPTCPACAVGAVRPSRARRADSATPLAISPASASRTVAPIRAGAAVTCSSTAPRAKLAAKYAITLRNSTPPDPGRGTATKLTVTAIAACRSSVAIWIPLRPGVGSSSTRATCTGDVVSTPRKRTAAKAAHTCATGPICHRASTGRLRSDRPRTSTPNDSPVSSASIRAAHRSTRTGVSSAA